MKNTQEQSLAIALINESVVNRKSWIIAMQTISDLSTEMQLTELKEAISTSDNLTQEQKAFLLVVEDTVGLTELPTVFHCFQSIVNGDTTLAFITSAMELTLKQEVDIAQALQKQYNSKHVIFETTIDSTLIAGLKVQVGDKIVELSVRQSLNTGKKDLNIENIEVSESLKEELTTLP